jgi:type IV pilus assembly protein PilC
MKLDFGKILDSLQPIPTTEKIFFADRLRVMIKAGISLSQALQTLAEESRNQRFKKILNEVRGAVEKGEQFSAGLEKYPKIFGSFFRNMIKVGEVAGTMEKNLEELSVQMKKDHALLSKIRGAMTYPIIVLTATIFILIGLFTYVMPNMISIFETFGTTLPLPTRILITVTKVVKNYGLVVAAALAVIVSILVWFFHTKGKNFWHSVLMRFPIIGSIMKKVNLARFARTLSALMATDIPVVQSLEVTADVLGNVHYKIVALKAGEEIKKGVPISEVLKQHAKLFPPLITTMIAVGEKSGTTDNMLREVAEFYEEDVDQITTNLSTTIEPLLMLFLGVVVGGIALSVISPIYSLTEQF